MSTNLSSLKELEIGGMWFEDSLGLMLNLGTCGQAHVNPAYSSGETNMNDRGGSTRMQCLRPE